MPNNKFPIQTPNNVDNVNCTTENPHVENANYTTDIPHVEFKDDSDADGSNAEGSNAEGIADVMFNYIQQQQEINTNILANFLTSGDKNICDALIEIKLAIDTSSRCILKLCNVIDSKLSNHITEKL